MATTMTKDTALQVACEAGNLAEVTRLIGEGADPRHQRDSDGRSPLMAAAAAGSIPVLTLLLQEGAPWNALDRSGRCAGNYAVNAGNQEAINLLVNAGVRAELLLGTLERRARGMLSTSQSRGASCGSENSDIFLSRNVRYEGDNLMDDDDDAVMMAWETPLMQAHAQVLCDAEPEDDGNAVDGAGKREDEGESPLAMATTTTSTSNNVAQRGAEGTEMEDTEHPHQQKVPQRGLDILNIGFGMGIFDGVIQSMGSDKIRSHTIVEAHPGVLQKIIRDGWVEKKGVTIIFARWQDALQAKKNSSGGKAEGSEKKLQTTTTIASTAAAATAAASTVVDTTPVDSKAFEIPDSVLGSGALVDRKYDCIFFDTYGEYYEDMQVFHQHLPQLLRKGGRYSFFNGLCPDNLFFHGVVCAVVQQELGALGLSTQFLPCAVEGDVTAADDDNQQGRDEEEADKGGEDQESVGNGKDGAADVMVRNPERNTKEQKQKKKVWKGVKRRYWNRETYYLPVAIKQ